MNSLYLQKYGEFFCKVLLKSVTLNLCCDIPHNKIAAQPGGDFCGRMGGDVGTTKIVAVIFISVYAIYERKLSLNRHSNLSDVITAVFSTVGRTF